jgi:hypothetical protein
MKRIRFVVLGIGLCVAMCIGASGNTEAATPTFAPVMDFGTGCLLGGALDRRFIPADEATKKITGGEVYKIYGLQGRLGKAIGTKPASIGVPCEDVTAISTTPSHERENVVGLGSTWAGMPRVPIAISPNLVVYKNAVSDLLKARGIAHPTVMIDQIYRIDLEGDGVSEVLISASYFKHGNVPQPSAGPSPDADAGDYSIVFMRKLVAGVVQTVVLAENVYTQDAEFIAPNQYRLRGVMDINGDGTMEILMFGRYYEGQWTSVFQVKGTDVQEVLSCGCGV